MTTITRYECSDPNCSAHFATRIAPRHNLNNDTLGPICLGSGKEGELVEVGMPKCREHQMVVSLVEIKTA